MVREAGSDLSHEPSVAVVIRWWMSGTGGQALADHIRTYRSRFSSIHVPAKRCAAFRNNGASGLDFDSSLSTTRSLPVPVVNNPHAAESRHGRAQAATLRRRARRWQRRGFGVWAELGEKRGDGACGLRRIYLCASGVGGARKIENSTILGRTLSRVFCLARFQRAMYCSTAQ